MYRFDFKVKIEEKHQPYGQYLRAKRKRICQHLYTSIYWHLYMFIYIYIEMCIQQVRSKSSFKTKITKTSCFIYFLPA